MFYGFHCSDDSLLVCLLYSTAQKPLAAWVRHNLDHIMSAFDRVSPPICMMLHILFLPFFVCADALIPLDSTPVVKSYLNSSRPLRNNFGRSRISRNLVKRQSCTDSLSLVCQDQSCCPTGGACCSVDNTTVDGK